MQLLRKFNSLRLRENLKKLNVKKMDNFQMKTDQRLVTVQKLLGKMLYKRQKKLKKEEGERKKNRSYEKDKSSL